MLLVRTQNMALAGEAVPSGASEVKGLDAREGNADRVSVVRMRGKGLTMEMSLDALDALRSRRDPDAIAATGQVFPMRVYITVQNGPNCSRMTSLFHWLHNAD
jgi:hypothetical protein